ncbi:MAG: hypothetical protein EAX96_12015 [Candidatus Lokiarchaeota archaeon]|nr:hypothetical protein [Candidatus Lokiarchaeota archaeon]
MRFVLTGCKWHELYLSDQYQSEYQIILRKNDREWALVPETGMSRVSLKFNETWDRRVNSKKGGENQVLESLLSFIGSWSAALALIEDFE